MIVPTYRYVAKKSPKEVVEETLEASNREEVLSHLSNLGYVPLQISDSAQTVENKTSSGKLNQKIPGRHLLIFTRQLTSLIKSQIPIVRALTVLKDQIPNQRFRLVIDAMNDSIQKEGQSFSDAMQKFSNVFTSDYINLIRAGEMSGALEDVLNGLSARIEREESIKSKLQAALVYPLFVAVVGVLTIIFLLTFVMPQILKLFVRFKMELPLPTRILIAVTNTMGEWWFWLVAIGTIAFLVFAWKKIVDANPVIFDRLILKLPVIGNLLYQIDLARFCRSLGLMLNHGVLILPALQSALTVVQNKFFQSEFEALPLIVKEGGALTEGLKKTKLASSYLVNTVVIGEEGGRVGEALTEVSNYYDQEAERTIQVFSGLIEPMIILVIGLFVGFIVMAVLLPIFEMSGLGN